MEQPTHYNSEDELVAWLKYDLDRQREIIAERYDIYEDINNKDLVLNIGNKKNMCVSELEKIVETTIDFNLSIGLILFKLGYIEYDDNIIIDFKIQCQKVIFKGKTDFSRSTFSGDADFSRSTFDGKADFTLSTFSGYASFGGSTFSGDANFSCLNIHKKLILNELKFQNIFKIIFDNIQFKDSNSLLQIKNSESTFANISFKDILIKGRLDIQNIKTDNADFTGAFVNGGVVNTVKFDVKNFENRESALFLKHQAYIMHNNIEALQYKAKEMEIHRSDLKKIKNKTWENRAEIFSMFLSKRSNNHGQNWLQAIGFTILVPLLFFTIFYSPTLDISNIPKIYYNSLLHSFVEYFIPTKYEQVINYAGYKSINIFVRIAGIFIYLVGKIAFGYGSVQVVQAFRKYGKSS